MAQSSWLLNSNVELQKNIYMFLHGGNCGGVVPRIWMVECGQDSLRSDLHISEDAFVFG